MKWLLRKYGYPPDLQDTAVQNVLRQAEALSLDRSLGFAEVEPYYHTPPPLRDWLVFLKLDLRPPEPR